LLPSGCGGSASNQAARTAAFVAAANKVCRDQKDNREVPSLKERDASEFRRLARTDFNLPSLRKFRSDIQARRKLRERVQRATKGKSDGILPPGIEPLEESYRLGVKIYNDEKALGMTACATKPRAPIGG
jgi:hypothetical protein